MPLQLRQLELGKIDGKHEYLTPRSDKDGAFFDAFLIPASVDPDRLNNADIFFVRGFRGTGKTSLLRWFSENRRKAGAATDFVLFKSDLSEQQRVGISKEAGITWVDVDPKRMEFSQDFKSTWQWFIYHKIGETLLSDTSLAPLQTRVKFAELLGLESNVFSKVLGFLPKLEGAQVKIKTNLPFFELELGGDFRREGEIGFTSLDALNKRLEKLIKSVEFSKPLYIFFDELEVFYHSPEQHRRDQRMVRDLLFSILATNDHFRKNNLPVHIIAAIRSEVLDAMGSLGQEVDRLVHDKGFNIAWHLAKRSLNNPLLDIIRRKIWVSEAVAGVEKSPDPIGTYFPKLVNGDSIEIFLLDRSFYKPRDLVWRLTLAQKQFPDATRFEVRILTETETDYSSRLWDEIKYELSASYSDEEIDVIEIVFSGSALTFFLADVENAFRKFADKSPAGRSLLNRRSVEEILDGLYRLGAIGNSFRAGTTGNAFRNRWVFRGDPTLLANKRMTIHPALAKRLSAVAARRRGVRGGRDR